MALQSPLQKTFRTAAALLTAWMGLGAAYAHQSPSSDKPVVNIVTVQTAHDPQTLSRLVAEGYEIAGVDFEQGLVDVILDGQHESLSLHILGFAVQAVRTIDTTLAPDEGYKTPAEVTFALQRIADMYPDITRLVSIGKTHEGRDILALKITDNPDERETNEPAILFNALHHAREVMTVEVAFDIIERLTSRYSSDARTAHWVDANEIWVVPQVNPDGSNRVWSGHNMWRKNTRDGHGVDINRNYPFDWGSCNGSSSNPRADNYRGPEAGSEPETRAMMDLVARIQPVFDISYHSYSELVLYPFGCSNRHTATKDVIETLGRELASKLVRDSGQGTYTPGTPWEILYSADGGDMDWMYNEHHVIPYAIEINSGRAGFQPPYRLVQPTVEKMRKGWEFLLEKLDQSGVRGLVKDESGVALTSATVTVSKLAAAPASSALTTYHVKRDGTYHIVLNPGTYHLQFTAGERKIDKQVTIGHDRLDLDVEI